MRWEFDIVPMGYVRQTRSDRWRKRPVVLRYHAYRDQLQLLAKGQGFEVPAAGLCLIFILPIPAGLSKKEHIKRSGQPHTQRPDVDNLIKAFFDALCEDDAYVWDVRGIKLWGPSAKIIAHVE